jgi:hypothetical protein
MADIKDNKLTRELTTRAVQERPKQWAQPDLLPEPDKEPGYNYRWIRISTMNNADPRNLSAKLREGWEPVALEEQPKFRLLADPNSRFKDNIEVGGLLLCKTPSEFVEQRNNHFAKVTQSQSDAVDNSFMRQSDARMPLFQERKSSSSFGKGT